MEGADFDHDILDTWPIYMAGEAVVINGFSLLTNSIPIAGSDLIFNVNIQYDNGDVSEVKFYYYKNFDPVAYAADPDGYEAANRVDIEWAGDLPTGDNFYNFTIPNTEFTTGDTFIWYMRAKDGVGDKKYFTRGQDENFDKDIVADWDEITIQ